MSPPYLTIIVVLACVSIVTSFSVVLTFVLFRDMRGKFFMQIIGCIAFCDTVANLSYALLPYRPSSDHWLCTLQGMNNAAMYPMSWLWTLALMYHLYLVATTGSLPSLRLIRATHLVCWGIPLAFSLGTLAVTNWTESEMSFDICQVNDNVSGIYHGVTYYGLLLVVLCAMLVIYLRTLHLQRQRDVQSFHPSYAVLKSSSELYPTVLVVCWLPRLVVFSVYPARSMNFAVYEIFFVICTALKISHGMITALLFFRNSHAARRLWARLLLLTCLCPSERTRDDSTSLSVDLELEEAGILPHKYSFNLRSFSDNSVRNSMHSVNLS